MTTGTGEPVLIVMSGNVLGFGVIEVPFMLMTFAEGEPAVGSRSRNGVDCARVPLTLPAKKAPVLSSRIIPGPPRMLHWPVLPATAVRVPDPVIAFETSRMDPPLPPPAHRKAAVP